MKENFLRYGDTEIWGIEKMLNQTIWLQPKYYTESVVLVCVQFFNGPS